jgi:hypothetical protein
MPTPPQRRHRERDDASGRVVGQRARDGTQLARLTRLAAVEHLFNELMSARFENIINFPKLQKSKSTSSCAARSTRFAPPHCCRALAMH